MAALDLTTRGIIENDYQTETGNPPVPYNEQYTDKASVDIWRTGGSHTLDMGVPLGTTQTYFDPANPDFYEEPNLHPQQAYDIKLGGWFVTVGNNPAYDYVVRVADAQYELRDVNQSPETTFYARKKQVRRRNPYPRHFL